MTFITNTWWLCDFFCFGWILTRLAFVSIGWPRQFSENGPIDFEFFSVRISQKPISEANLLLIFFFFLCVSLWPRLKCELNAFWGRVFRIFIVVFYLINRSNFIFLTMRHRLWNNSIKSQRIVCNSNVNERKAERIEPIQNWCCTKNDTTMTTVAVLEFGAAKTDSHLDFDLIVGNEYVFFTSLWLFSQRKASIHPIVCVCMRAGAFFSFYFFFFFRRH